MDKRTSPTSQTPPTECQIITNKLEEAGGTSGKPPVYHPPAYFFEAADRRRATVDEATFGQYSVGQEYCGLWV